MPSFRSRPTDHLKQAIDHISSLLGFDTGNRSFFGTMTQTAHAFLNEITTQHWNWEQTNPRLVQEVQEDWVPTVRGMLGRLARCVEPRRPENL